MSRLLWPTPPNWFHCWGWLVSEARYGGIRERAGSWLSWESLNGVIRWCEPVPWTSPGRLWGPQLNAQGEASGLAADSRRNAGRARQGMRGLL